MKIDACMTVYTKNLGKYVLSHETIYIENFVRFVVALAMMCKDSTPPTYLVDPRDMSYADDNSLLSVSKQLALKREALLESIRRKKQQRKAEEELKQRDKQLSLAIYELIRLGYNFDKIVVEGGINEQFLKHLYEKIGLPVIRQEPSSIKIAVTNDDTQTRTSKEAYKTECNSARSGFDVSSRTNSRVPTPPSVVRRGTSIFIERPAWLDDLIIDLVSSEDEESGGSNENREAISGNSEDTEEEAGKEKVETLTVSVTDLKAPPTKSTLNIGAEVTKVMMRLKIEITKLKQQLNNMEEVDLDGDIIENLLQKKKSMIQDIESLFDILGVGKIREESAQNSIPKGLMKRPIEQEIKHHETKKQKVEKSSIDEAKMKRITEEGKVADVPVEVRLSGETEDKQLSLFENSIIKVNKVSMP